MKLNAEKRKNIIEMYQSGNFTRMELSRIFQVTRRTIDYILLGVKKPFKYDAMNKSISLDQLKDKGRDIPDMTYEPLSLLTKPSVYSKIVKCPSCAYKATANRLLVHLIERHARFDLEYLL